MRHKPIPRPEPKERESHLSCLLLVAYLLGVAIAAAVLTTVDLWKDRAND